MKDINYDELDPGIRKVVRFLNEKGFRTTDSGDGVSKVEMECAMPFPNVTMVTSREMLLAEADRLCGLLTGVGFEFTESGHDDVKIQASYDPADGSAIILLTGLNDEALTQKL